MWVFLRFNAHYVATCGFLLCQVYRVLSCGLSVSPHMYQGIVIIFVTTIIAVIVVIIVIVVVVATINIIIMGVVI